MVFLEKFYTPLVLAHLLITFALTGSMTHNLLIVIRYPYNKFAKKKLEQFYVKISFWLYLTAYTTGTLTYPAFGIYIRRGHFDSQLPWATGLFEVKEHWGAMGLTLFFVYYILRKNFDPQNEKEKLYLYVPLCILLNAISWYKIIVGCYLTQLKGAF